MAFSFLGLLLLFFSFQNFIYLPIQYTPLTYTIYITLTNTNGWRKEQFQLNNGNEQVKRNSTKQKINYEI